MKQIDRRVYDGAVQEAGDGRNRHEDGDDEREGVHQREITPGRQTGATPLICVHSFRLLVVEDLDRKGRTNGCVGALGGRG